jgi:hypothetical protein
LSGILTWNLDRVEHFRCSLAQDKHILKTL